MRTALLALALAATVPACARSNGAAPAPAEKAAGLAHPVVAGALGPFPRASVELRYADVARANGFTGTVRTPAAHPLPDPDEPPDFFAVRVSAVMFADADTRPGNELLVLYSAQKIAPGEPAYYAVAAYGWSGAAFVRLPQVEERLDGSRDAAQVRARLARARAA